MGCSAENEASFETITFLAGKNYFACIISDALACCTQGIEFELTDAYSYPADYPKEGDEICVVGTSASFAVSYPPHLLQGM